MNTADMIHQLRLELWNLSYIHWKTQTLFSIQWWSMVTFIAICYAIWWVIVDKRQLSQILLFGSLVAVGRIVLLTTFGILKFYNWNYFYSFILIIGIASLSRWVLLGVLSIQQNYEYAKDESRTLNYQPAMKPLDKESDNREDKN